MALLRDVIYKAGPKLRELVAREADLFNLKIVNKLTIRFDPFREDVKEIRNFSHLIYGKGKVSNPRLIIKTEILSDRSEQSLTFDLTDGKKFVFQCGNLKYLEIAQLINQHITPLSPKEELIASGFGVIQSGQDKGSFAQKAGKGKKGKK